MLDMMNCRGFTRLMLLAGLSAPGLPAYAQVPQPTGVDFVTVTIVTPVAGAIVSGTIPVEANVGGVGASTVTGVQFKLDGANLGEPDSTPPYAVSWDTTGASDGSHTLTAIARDMSGFEHRSEPVVVTVANVQPPAPTGGRIEENDASVSYSFGWTGADNTWFGWSGGSAMQTRLPGARVTFRFTGTSVTWIGYRSGRSGIARVYVDGELFSEVDLFARNDEIHVPILTVKGLSNASHSLTIEATGLMNSEAVSGDIVIDAFDVPAPVVSHLQETDPDVGYTAGWSPANAGIAWSAGAAIATSVAGAQAEIRFNGTAISLYGYRAPDAGIARVFVDDVLAQSVDLYSPTHAVQGVFFTASGLTDGNHRLVLEATGERNDASGGALVVLDSFDVTRPGVRFQETDPEVAFTGSWMLGNRNRTWSEGTAAVSGTAGAQASFTFSGTSVSWIGFRAARTGIANIYLDGMFVAEVDTYVAAEGYQDTAYSISGLAQGTHTLTIEATGRRNPAATNNYVVVDAFDVRP